MKISFFDDDPRQFTDSENYPVNHGPFSEVAIQMNRALDKLGLYAPPDEADFVGKCDGMQLNFQYKDKKSFLIHVWETSNCLPHFFLQQKNIGQILFGLSEQISNLWHRHGFKDVKTVYAGCDTEYWHQTQEKDKVFTFLHVNSSNIRSGLDLTITAFYNAFKNSKDAKLLIKDTNTSTKLLDSIKFFQDKGCNIEYISERLPSDKVRDLYSRSHVCLNVLRATSFGLPLLESSACNCLCVTGDVPPTNEIINNENGVLIPPLKEVELYKLNYLIEDWGLLNCYPDFPYLEKPKVWDYSLFEYSEFLKDIYNEWDNVYKKIDTRTDVVEDWQWEQQAEILSYFLEEYH